MKQPTGTKDENAEDKGIVFEVTQEQYDSQRAQGFDDDEIMRPGKHVFKRVPKHRLATRADLRPSNTKVQITMKVDLDVLNHFKSRSQAPNAAPYQTQINAELRKIMERDVEQENAEIDETARRLLEDDDFLKSLYKKLKEKDLILS